MLPLFHLCLPACYSLHPHMHAYRLGVIASEKAVIYIREFDTSTLSEILNNSPSWGRSLQGKPYLFRCVTLVPRPDFVIKVEKMQLQYFQCKMRVSVISWARCGCIRKCKTSFMQPEAAHLSFPSFLLPVLSGKQLGTISSSPSFLWCHRDGGGEKSYHAGCFSLLFSF